MNTHNDFLDNAVNDELETEGIEDLTTDVCSDMQNDTETMCLSLLDATYRMCGGNTKETYLEILYFRQFYRHFVFIEDGDGNRNKKIEKYFEVSAGVDMGCGGTKNSYF